MWMRMIWLSTIHVQEKDEAMRVRFVIKFHIKAIIKHIKCDILHTLHQINHNYQDKGWQSFLLNSILSHHVSYDACSLDLFLVGQYSPWQKYHSLTPPIYRSPGPLLPYVMINASIVYLDIGIQSVIGWQLQGRLILWGPDASEAPSKLTLDSRIWGNYTVSESYITNYVRHFYPKNQSNQSTSIQPPSSQSEHLNSSVLDSLSGCPKAQPKQPTTPTPQHWQAHVSVCLWDNGERRGQKLLENLIAVTETSIHPTTSLTPLLSKRGRKPPGNLPHPWKPS